jgi:heme exporter protein B
MSEAQSHTARDMPSMAAGFTAIVRRDLLLAWKRPGDVLTPLLFFMIVSSLFPFALAPDAGQLRLIGPGVVWVAALLATLLSLNTLFLGEYEDGSLEQLLLSPQPLPLVAAARMAAHWIVSGVPLIVVSPLVAVSYQLPPATIRVMLATLALGTLSLSALGSIGAALTVGVHRGGALLALLVLPLAVPVLIFGARTVSLAAAEDVFAAGVYFLGAYCMLALTLAPFAAAAALKISHE